MQTKIKELWGRSWPFLVTALVCLALGYYAGTTGRPDRLETKSHVEEKSHVEDKQQISATEDVRAAEKMTEKRVRRKVRVEFRPDGTKSSETTTVSGTNIDVTKIGTTDRQIEGTSSEVSSNVRTRDEYKLVLNRRDWRLGVLLGAQLRNPGSLEGLTTGTGPFNALVVGIQAEARLGFIPKIGDHLWVGVWATAVPQQMAIAKDPLNFLNVGFSLGVEF